MAKPFLKWAGGKGKIAQRILDSAPPEFGRYIEPFVGGGAVFFALREAYPDVPATLGDSNEGLIEAYSVIRDDVGCLVAELSGHSEAYLARTAREDRAEYFYEQRSNIPNTPAGRAARLLFLNKTCYNGLYRVNRDGRFNTPHGRYAQPTILDRDVLLAASAALQGAELVSGTFEGTCSEAGKGDFVYLDPPYQPLSKTASFTAYTAQDFDATQQQALKETFDDLTARGVKALLSNSDHPAVRELYDAYDSRTETLPMSRAINSKGKGRKPIDELLIRNF
jgi:DNA adenine methylase